MCCGTALVINTSQAVHKLDNAIIALSEEARQSGDERIKRNQPLGELYL